MGGPRMAAAGVDLVVRAEDMAVMGMTEIIRHLPRIYREFRKLKRAILARRPTVAVLIDFPDIHFRLARLFHQLGVPVIYFVSPQLWAWKQHRIQLVRKYVRRMLVIFPFEEQFYRQRGVAAEFVGHPLAELPPPSISREQFAAENHLDPARTSVDFRTVKAGTLRVSKRGADLLEMDFPSRPAQAAEPPPGLVAALGGTPQAVLRARDCLVVYGSAAEVAALQPDMAALAKVDCWAAIATAPGENGVDFVSRFFAPAQGVPEDPVTGSAHCTLVPYWAKRLGKMQLEARQLSRRGGALYCALQGDRVNIGGRAVVYLDGQIEV